MRILLVDVVCKTGSTGKIVYDLYRSLRASGYEASVCYGRGPLIDEPDIVKISSDWEVLLHALLTRVTGLTSCFSPFATRRLLRHIDEYKPDLVNLHELHGYYLNIGRVMEHLKERKIRTVWTFHCEFMYTGKCGHSNDCVRWQSECGNCPQKRSYPSSWLFDFSKRMQRQKKRAFDGFAHLAIVTPSNWLAKRVRQSFLRDKSVCSIPNGIDTGIFKPRDSSGLAASYGLADCPTVLHVTANFEDPNKGGRFVRMAAKRLPEIRFLIVGNHKPVNDCPPNVVVVGRVENPDILAQFYSFADLSLITSYRETFPTVCLESLCCGTPVVGFRGGGTVETAPDGYGLFVPFGDLDALEEALRRCLSGELRSKEECAAFGLAQYAKERMCRDYLQMYSEIKRQ